VLGVQVGGREKSGEVEGLRPYHSPEELKVERGSRQGEEIRGSLEKVRLENVRCGRTSKRPLLKRER